MLRCSDGNVGQLSLAFWRQTSAKGCYWKIPLSNVKCTLLDTSAGLTVASLGAGNAAVDKTKTLLSGRLPSSGKVNVRVAHSCLTLCDPMRSHGLSVFGIFQAKIVVWEAFRFSRGSSQSRDWTQVSRITGGFFSGWATEKPKNIGVGSLSLLQRIFPTQELNSGLLHCRQIFFYQLSYQERPRILAGEDRQ